MKTTSHYFLGALTGITAAFFIPPSTATGEVLADIAGVVLDVGRYLMLPLVFFSLPVAVTQLRRLGVLRRVLTLSTILVIASSVLLALIGTLIAIAIPFERLPVAPGQMPEIEIATFSGILKSILRFEGIRSGGREGTLLLALIFPAFLLGWHFYHDKEISEPAYNIFDSLSRIIYRTNRYLLVLMPFFLAILSLHAIYAARLIVDFTRFIPLLAILFGTTAVLILGIYPLAVWLLTGYRSPWFILKGIIAPCIGALVSGAPMFNYGNLTYHLKEKLRISRQLAALTAPLYTMFARGGTALVSAFCILTVVRSYSSLQITFFQAGWTALFAFLISFTLPTTPDKGLTISLMLLGSLYGRGLEESWLILVPVLPVLIMISALLDTTTGAVSIAITNIRADLEEDESIKHDLS